MRHHARGTFEVDLQPLVSHAATPESGIARMSIDKQFRGDLDAASKGEMLSAGAPRSGSAGYVAIEHVQGTLDGRNGGFALQHSGTLRNGDARLAVNVVPGSGTGELEGIAGSMAIVIADGKHSYDLEYSLGDEA
ncbi:MAG: DUF3224 domain-containing protein [Rhodanobacteraceae bacterium]